MSSSPTPGRIVLHLACAAALSAGLCTFDASATTPAPSAPAPSAPAPSTPVLSAPVLSTPGPQRLLIDYALSSHGLQLVDMHASTQLSPNGYAIEVHTRTVGLVGVLAPSDVWSTAEGRFDGDRVLPVFFCSAGHSRGADRTVRIDYPNGNPVLAVLTPPEPDREPVTPEQARGGIDTLGAVVELSRLVARTGRCDGAALVFDGRRLSRLEVRTVGTETVPAEGGPGFSGPALRCDFVSRQLGGFLRDNTRARLLKPLHGSAWLAPPLAGAPVAAVRAVFESPLFGRATLRLVTASSG